MALFSLPGITSISSGDMASSLSPAKLVLIRDMIGSQSFTISQMAELAESNKLTIINIRRNLRQIWEP
jgi:predicted transcriptional regulator